MASIEKKFLLERNGYKLYSAHGDTSKRWFVYWYNDFAPGEQGGKKRTKIYGGINHYSSPELRFKAAENLLLQLENGEFQQQYESTTLQGVFDRHFSERCKGLRTKTRATYASKVNAFLDYTGKHRIDSLEHITRPAAQKFLDSIKKGPTTVNSYRDTLRMFFEDFIASKLITVNPFESLKKLPESRRGKFPFNTSQAAQLKKIISQKHPVLWMACQLQYYCFIRPAEIRLLQLEHINLDENFILVPASISKNKKTQPVSIPTAFEPVLRKWLENVSEQNHYVLNRHAVPVGNNNLNKLHRKILKDLGYSSRYSLYSWKHTGAVTAVKAGIGLKNLQMQIRHHSLDQLNEYLREMGIMDSVDVRNNFPAL